MVCAENVEVKDLIESEHWNTPVENVNALIGNKVLQRKLRQFALERISAV